MSLETSPSNSTRAWIFSSDAAFVVASTREKLVAKVSLNKLIVDLRKQLAPELANQAVEMAQLQFDARKKFSAPNEMLFTRKGLEQSTSEPVAKFKASLIDDSMSVADACCGIGGDSMAFADRHVTVAVELDWSMAQIANHNLGLGAGNISAVIQADFNQFDFSRFDFVHVDPDRRPGKSRTTKAEYANPPWDSIASRLGKQFAAVKLAPAAILDEHQSQVHRQWIGSGRECREQIAWFNAPQFPAGGKTATVLDGNGDSESISSTFDDQPDVCWEPKTGDCLFEPHSAVFAAGLDGTLATRQDMQRLSNDSPYLIGAQPLHSGLFQSFQILHIDSLDRKRMIAAFREMDVGKIEWKQRGVEPAAFQTVLKLKGPGSTPSTVVLFRIDRRLNFAICRRI